MSGLSPGLAAFKLAFQLSPIILTNGIANGVPFNMLPIIVFTEGINFAAGLLTGASDISLDNFFANFEPAPGSTLIKNEIGHYPFANQAVAANAIITMPLNISMRMICPARRTGGYAVKFAIMQALKSTLQNHNAQGGTYTVVTPAYIYTSCILLDMVDVGTRSRQVQAEYRLDFTQPLLTFEQAQQAMNNMMQKISAGVPTAGTLAGGAALTGLFPVPGSIVPSAASLPGMSATSLLPS